MNIEKIKKRMRKILELVMVLLIAYPYGVLTGIVFQILRLFRVIKIVHWERFPKWRKKVILVSNHPSIADPFLLAPLFFWQYLFRPFQYGPVNLPDQSIFYNQWYFRPFRYFMVPVDRKTKGAGSKVFFLIQKLLDCGRILVMFPEGRRTHKAKDYFYSRNGHRIGMFTRGLGWIAIRTGATIVPVWIEGSDKFLPNRQDRYLPDPPNFKEQVVIRIGDPMTFRRHKKASVDRDRTEKVSQRILHALLELADEE